MSSQFGGVQVTDSTKTGSQFGGVPVEAGPDNSFGAFLREYGSKMNPAAMARGMADTTNDILTGAKSWRSDNEAIAKQAEDAYHRGDYKGALRHGLNYLLNGIPGLGASLDAAGNKLDQGDVAGGLGDTAALATQAALGIKGPAILRGAREVAPAVATGAKGAIVGGAKAALDARNVTGAGAAEWVAQQMGLPKGTGAAIAGAPKVIQGAVEGARAALDARLARMAEAANQPAATPAAAPPEQPRALLEAGAIPMPAAADASFVRTVEPPRAVIRDPRTGRMMRVYSGSDQPLAPNGEPAPAPLVIDVTPQSATPPAPPPTAAATPAPGNGMGGMKQYSGDYNPAALTDEQIDALNKPQPTADTPATPETPAAWQPKPNGGGRMSRSTMQEVSDFQGRARSRKADQLAKFLHNAGGRVEAGQGVSYADAAAMTTDQWKLAAQGARVNQPSVATIRQALWRLRQLEADQAPTQ